MIELGDILCVIPARSGSKGLKNKNKKFIAGHPLTAWPIIKVRLVNRVSHICVSTNDPDILKIAHTYGAKAPFIRPDYLSDDKASSVDVVLHAISFWENSGITFKYVLLLEPTSPLTEKCDIEEAVARLVNNRDSYDAIVSVIRADTFHPRFAYNATETGNLIPMIDTEGSGHLRRQDISKCFFPDGSLYLSDIEILKKRKTFYHERTGFIEMPKEKSFEIDDQTDFDIVEMLLRQQTGYTDG